MIAFALRVPAIEFPFALNDSSLTRSWQNMEAAKKRGLCRHIGVSNYPVDFMKAKKCLSLTPRQSFSLRLVHFHCCRRLMNIRRSRFTISSKSYIPLHNFETSKSMPGKPKLHWLDMEQALSTKSCGQNPIIRTSLRLLETIESEFRQDKVLKRIEVFRQLDAWYCCRLHADATKIHQRSQRPCSSPLPKLPHSQALWFPRLWLKRLH